MLRRCHHLSDLDAERALTAMRLHGARIDNCRKNVGAPRYAFNSFQQSMLPKPYRPPPQVAGKGAS